jgi:hypothetical protein
MLRWLYIQFIWLHPAPFRWRFGDDMLDDFDRAPNRAKLRYLADAVVSIARQWLFRPEFRHPQASAAMSRTLPGAVGVPLFQTIEAYKPRPAALFHGGLLAILSIYAAVAVIGKGGDARPFLIGAASSRPGLVPIDRNSAPAGKLKTTVKLGPDSLEEWLKLARPYFRLMPVLRALDTDGDFTLSSWEIGNAPAALRNLVANRAGKLTAEECGLHIDPNAPPRVSAQLRRQFMSDHPVLNALDADHDGEISAWEIDHAPAALRKLDRDHNGHLTADELLPSEMAAHAGRR